MRWECTECGAVTVRPGRPSRCKKCDSRGAVFLAVEEPEPHAAERMYEEWVRHGMRTTRRWRSHAA